MQSKGNPCALLVGVQTGVAAAWSFLRKLEMELLCDPLIPLLGIYLKRPKTLIRKNICTPMFIAVLFTIAKAWKHLRCPSVDEWIKKLLYIYTGTLLGCKKEGNHAFCDSMDRPRAYYAE